jgi:hypothetical protein
MTPTTITALRNAFAFLALLASALLATALPASAASYHVVVRGVNLATNPAPLEQGGRVFVPMRAVFEGLNAGVAYDNGTINATSGDKTVQVKIGSNQAIVSGQQEYLDAAPFLVDSTTMVPLRFVSEALGAVVNYDASTGAIDINPASIPLAVGSVINATLNNDVNTGSAYVGQPIALTVQSGGDARLNGSTIYGKVADVQAAYQGTNPQLDIAIDSIKLAGSADQQPIAAKVVKIDPRKGSILAKQAGGTLAGMLIGNWIGKSIDSNIGGAVGAVGGYMLTSNSKANFDVPAGSPVVLELTDALALR